MQKYEKFPEVFSLSKKIKRDKTRLKEMKKELAEYRYLLNKKKSEYPQIKSEMKVLYNKRLLDLETAFENEIAKARFQKVDVNKLYEDYKNDRNDLSVAFNEKINLRQIKAKDEIASISSAYKLRVRKIRELNSLIKENKVTLKEKWSGLKLQRIANEVIFKQTYLEVRDEAAKLIREYSDEYKEEKKKMIDEFQKQHPQIQKIEARLRYIRNHKIKPFKNESDSLIYELSIEINFLKTQLKSKVEYQESRVLNAKLEIAYNRGKTAKVPLKVHLEHFALEVNKFSNWKFIIALRNGFFALMPLIIVGAIFIIFNNTFISPEYGGFLNLFSFTIDTLQALDRIRGIGVNIYNAGFAFYALLLSGAIAYNLAPHYGASRWTMTILAMACYIVVNPAFLSDFSVMGTSGLLTGVLISMFASVIYGNLSRNERLKIPIDKTNVPEGVIRSFNVIVPFGITLIIFSLIEFAISYSGYAIGEIDINGTKTTVTSLNQVVVLLFQYPLTEAISGLFGMVLVIFLWQTLWVIGVNPQGIITPIIEPLQLNGLLQNQANAAIGEAPQYIFTNSFQFSFIQIGGSGGTVGLILAILLFSKRAEWRSVVKLSLVPMLFSINEPILFGIPIILNPILAIPFIIGPISIGIMSYLATVNGIVNYTTVLVPQNIMPIFGGFASTRDYMGISLSIFNIFFLTITYFPFVIFANKMKKKEQAKNFKMNQLPNIIILKGLEIKRRREQENKKLLKKQSEEEI